MSDAGLPSHPQADDGNFGDLIIMRNPLDSDRSRRFANRFQRCPQFAHRNAERNIRSAFASHVLHNHVDGDLSGSDSRENLQARSRDIGDAVDGHASFIASQRCAGDGSRIAFRFFNDHCSLDIRKAAANVNRHTELFGELDRATMHHASTEASQFQHLVIADHIDSTRLRKDSRVRRINSIHIGINLTSIRIQDRCQRDGRRIAAASA